MRRNIIIPIFLLLAAGTLQAQNVTDLIISEVLAEPDSTGILDDYGRRGGWIELYNTSQGTVNFGGCFLTDDRDNLRKSLIPKGDLRTKIGPRQTALFYASGNGLDGTFYAGVTLAPGSTVYLVSNDGRTIIDSLTVPPTLPQGKSVGKLAHDLRGQVFEVEPEPMVPSPGIANGDQNAATKAQVMAEKDPHGWTLTIVSVSVVFAALAILWGFFVLLFRLLANGEGAARKPRKKAAAGAVPPEVAAAIALALDMEDSGEVYAAIAAAVDLYLTDTVHDAEPFVITLRPSDSPWNEKSQMFRQLPK
ncbi:MAG: OadG family protein [Bacteroidales bacterium]|nr:OadG family protein [Bacteroidales bacterium]